MLRPIVMVALVSTFYCSLCAVPVRAVIRFDRIGAVTDSLILPPEQIKTFHNSLRAGGDLSTTGTYLFSISLLLPMLAGAAGNLGVGDGDGTFEMITVGSFIGGQLGFAAMASGNLIASRASRMDTGRVYSLNSRIAPYLGFAASAWVGAAMADAWVSCRESQKGCEISPFVLVPLVAELILAPILRIQYNRAAEYLRGVILVPSPGGVILSFSF